MSEDQNRDDIVDRITTVSRRMDAPTASLFPQVTGICRTCSKAWIWKRQYEEYPNVYCMVQYDTARVMPLDVSDCTEYERRGELSLRELADMAVLVDTRKKPGQYV
jgi:hypothetical protein